MFMSFPPHSIYFRFTQKQSIKKRPAMKQILCGYGINVGYCLTSEVNFEALFTPIVAINCESINVIIQYSFSNAAKITAVRSEEHTSELQSRFHIVCRL